MLNIMFYTSYVNRINAGKKSQCNVSFLLSLYLSKRLNTNYIYINVLIRIGLHVPRCRRNRMSVLLHIACRICNKWIK